MCNGFSFTRVLKYTLFHSILDRDINYKLKGKQTMATINPFKAIRPNKEKASRIAALPYDVYNREEARLEVEREPFSFLRIDRAETQFPIGFDIYDEKVYQKAHDILWEMVENGDFVTENQDCYYIYELTMNGRVQDGLVACASIDDYQNEVIKKHEKTREDKERDRIRHVDVCSAQTGPIYLVYRTNPVIREIIVAKKKEEPLYDFVSEDGIRHRVFRIERLEQIPYKRVLIITDPFVVSSGMIKLITHPLENARIDFEIFKDVVPDPPVEKIATGVKAMLEYKPDCIVAVGGGSAIDSSKSIRDFALKTEPYGTCALIAVPTTSGTGSEVTSFAVISDPLAKMKCTACNYGRYRYGRIHSCLRSLCQLK